MKLIFITESLGSGGAERQLTGLAVLLAAKGHQCTVVTWVNKNFYGAFLAENAVRHILLKPKGRLDRVFKLASIFRRECPDAAISFLPVANETAVLASLIAPVKLIVSERSYTTDWGWRRRMTNLLYRRADYVVANSNNEAQNIKKHCPKLASRTLAIPNYVDVERFSPAGLRHYKDGRPIKFVGVGRVIPTKNILNLLRAMAKVKSTGLNFIFDWYGSTYDKGYLTEVKKLVADLHLENVFALKGECKAIEEAYRRADVMCIPSTLEGYPNVLVEAMASGLPVVVSNVCEHPHIVDEDANGYLFNPYDVDEMADALIKAADLDSVKLASISLANRHKVVENNSMEAFVEQYVRLIESPK